MGSAQSGSPLSSWALRTLAMLPKRPVGFTPERPRPRRRVCNWQKLGRALLPNVGRSWFNGPLWQV